MYVGVVYLRKQRKPRNPPVIPSADTRSELIKTVHDANFMRQQVNFPSLLRGNLGSGVVHVGLLFLVPRGSRLVRKTHPGLTCSHFLL
jgi:hypothetical protein